MLEQARRAAERLVAACPEVHRVLLFGSFARDNYGPRSDLDLLVVLKDDSPSCPRDQRERYRRHLPAWPTELFAYTEGELAKRVAAGDPFLTRALAEAVELASAAG